MHTMRSTAIPGEVARWKTLERTRASSRCTTPALLVRAVRHRGQSARMTRCTYDSLNLPLSEIGRGTHVSTMIADSPP